MLTRIIVVNIIYPRNLIQISSESVPGIEESVCLHSAEQSGIPSHGKGRDLAGWIHFTPLYKQDLLSSSVTRDRNWCVETSE